MLIATLRFRRTFASVLLVVALTPHLAWSQATDDILPTEGSLAMEKEHRERSKGINMLLKGETPFDPKDAKQAEMLDYEARYMVYRLTWPEWQDNKDPQKNIDRLFHYCDLSWGQLSKDIAAGKVNKAVAANLTKAIITRAVEVIDNTRKPIGQINAARLLARLVDTRAERQADSIFPRLGVPDPGQPAVINDLAKALTGALGHKNDAVKYYATRGLRDMFRAQDLSKEKLEVANAEAAVTALANLILRRVEFVKDTPQDEIDGYRVLRREAIRALAQSRAPIVGAARPALTLLKVAADDGLVPEARGDERFEAVVGLGLMRPDEGKQYQPDYAAYHLALALADVARSIRTRDERPRAWKVHAAQLTDALTEMKNQSKNPFVTQVVDRTVKDLLAPMETGGEVNNERFLEAVQKMTLPSSSLYKDDAKATVKPRSAPAEK